MQEKLLQFIWQGKYFESRNLITEQGEPVTILDPGSLNDHQGPDFRDARLVINGTLWAGNIELHIRTSQWHQHHHTHDPRYRNVILHVVWENDDPVLSLAIPTLVLQPHVSVMLLDRYAMLMKEPDEVSCSKQLEEVPGQVWQEWLQDLVTERLNRKSSELLGILPQTRNNWEELTWWWLARHFGGPVNAAFFEQVARSIPFLLISKYRNQLIRLEALLLGQANLLEASHADPYVQLLQREYQFLQAKHQLKPVHGQAQFLRMRPAGFPTIRLAQLAAFLQTRQNIHSRLIASTQLKELEAMLDITANDFWHYHYRLEEPTPYQPKHIGRDMIHHLIINGIAPLVYAYGKHQQLPAIRQQALNWLARLPAEENQVCREWKRWGIVPASAAESQSLLELRKLYCHNRRCLECRIGNYLLNR
ncbi:DUF2851 family protein [Flavihumibacter rivuli]|uniref:DUF2851 family protein n=1 Tax=Flavihumibacter rivuli TaxID=2838156 RepID=UPI001BDF3909|nr:DUF2851 family protein [Flavihumibacter rivuli]ULQ57570.1 DUF2851 family protein [Flavihumibacter rivuli]